LFLTIARITSSVQQIGNVRAAAHELRVLDLLSPRAKVGAACIWGHEGELDVFTLARFGKSERLGRVEAKLRCRRCGKRGLCKLRVEWML
jgi:hypothetical protein